jgi:hypothetical protein
MEPESAAANAIRVILLIRLFFTLASSCRARGGNAIGPEEPDASGDITAGNYWTVAAAPTIFPGFFFGKGTLSSLLRREAVAVTMCASAAEPGGDADTPAERP